MKGYLKIQMILRWTGLSFIAAMIALSGCSTQAPKEELTDIIPASSDAGTDIVPSATPETATTNNTEKDVNSVGKVDIPDTTPPLEPTAPIATPTDTPIAETPPITLPDASPSPIPSGEPQAHLDTPANESHPDPAPAPAPVADTPSTSAEPLTPSSGPTEEYTVHTGDTLMKIAYDTYGDLFKWKQIYEDNKDKISNPNAIPKGTVLKIAKPVDAVSLERNGEKYRIKHGDTLGTISSSIYGTPTRWKSLWENNRQLIKNPNKIFAGFYLYYVADASSRQIGSTNTDAQTTLPSETPAAAAIPTLAAPSATAPNASIAPTPSQTTTQ